jgi:predicted amidohydrolase
VDRVARLVRSAGASGADLVVLPELWGQGGFAYDRWAEGAQPLSGSVGTAMREAAAAIGAHVHMGSLVERDGDRLYNTSVLLDPAGEIAATYRKIHLFGFGEGEPVLMSPGEAVVTAKVGDTTVGLATCYDLRFPELFRRLIDDGAEVIVLPAAWPARRVTHWSLLARARAIEDQVFVVACNTAGTHSGHAMGARSQVVGPTGEVLAEAAEGDLVLSVELDVVALDGVRRAFPVLADRSL